jgi:hypothetical protein
MTSWHEQGDAYLRARVEPGEAILASGRWSEGQRHDLRPILRIEHPAHRRLEWVPGESFVEQIPGTRATRTSGGVGVQFVRTGLRGAVPQLGRRLAMLDHDLHHGNIHWWIRVASWALLAVPAWFVSPWLVLPAVLLVEIAWVVGLWWGRRRERRRAVVRP